MSAHDDRVDPRTGRAVERALGARPSIADEQASMVRRRVVDSHGVAVVIRQAGIDLTEILAANASTRALLRPLAVKFK
jgi:hypothetical protein